jgi:hypothetical protein
MTFLDQSGKKRNNREHHYLWCQGIRLGKYGNNYYRIYG